MNDAERWRRVRSIFEIAVELDEPERAELLARECSDASLRNEVESLLRVDREASESELTGAVSAALRDSATAIGVGAQVGPYRVVGELGRGGMGVVLAGERVDGAYRKQVAIKILPSALHSDAAQRRFQDERQILADLEHPSIARLLEGGTTESGLNYLVMERVDGLSVDRYCTKHDLDIRARVRLVIEVCGAISHAHSRLVVHRDIKPSNVLVTRDGTPKLLDFGIAKLLDPSGHAPATQTVDWFLTPEFASPEQIEGRPITAATDVYGLGALLYYLLSSRAPLASVARTPTELMHAISHTRPEPPSVVAGRDGSGKAPRGRIARELDAIVAFALRKEPARRYASAEQLAADLRRFLEERPVRAIPDSLYYRASKLLRRQWIPVTAAVLTVASMGAGFTARELETRRAQREAESATQVADFLESLFTAATPEEALGNAVTAEDLLDRGAKRIQQELRDQPRLEAQLLYTMANCYRRLGHYDDAAELYQAALELRTEELGAHHLETAHALMGLGLVHTHAGRFSRGEMFMRRSIAIYEDRLENEHITRVNAYNELAANLGSQAWSPGKLNEAEQLLLRVGAFHDNHPESYRKEHVVHLRDLAGLYWEQGKHGLLIPTLELAVARSTQLLGSRDPFTLGTRSFLATALYEIGELERVTQMVSSLCPLIEETFGPHHDELSGCLRNQGAAFVELGQLQSAEAALGRALELEKVIYGQNHHYTAAIQVHMARLRLSQGDLATARLLLAPALQTLERGYGSGHHMVADALDLQARIRLAEGLTEEAEQMLRRALPIRLRVYGEGSFRARQTTRLLNQLSEPTTPARG